MVGRTVNGTVNSTVAHANVPQSVQRFECRDRRSDERWERGRPEHRQPYLPHHRALDFNPEARLLVVFDLNGTLVDAAVPPTHPQFIRPHTLSLLWALANDTRCALAVWSTRSYQRIREVLDVLDATLSVRIPWQHVLSADECARLQDSERPRLAEQQRGYTEQRDSYAHGRRGRTRLCKDLAYIWHRDARFGPMNTLVVDDTIDKVDRYPRNMYIVPTYCAVAAAASTSGTPHYEDDELAKLGVWLVHTAIPFWHLNRDIRRMA
jgi:hypothetical protein